jgi:hypothetical protein
LYCISQNKSQSCGKSSRQLIIVLVFSQKKNHCAGSSTTSSIWAMMGVVSESGWCGVPLAGAAAGSELGSCCRADRPRRCCAAVQGFLPSDRTRADRIRTYSVSQIKCQLDVTLESLSTLTNGFGHLGVGVDLFCWNVALSVWTGQVNLSAATNYSLIHFPVVVISPWLEKKQR